MTSFNLNLQQENSLIDQIQLRVSDGHPNVHLQIHALDGVPRPACESKRSTHFLNQIERFKDLGFVTLGCLHNQVLPKNRP